MADDAPEIQTSRTNSAQKLARCIAADRKRMQWLVDMRKIYAMQYAGPYYGEGAKADPGKDARIPLNLILSMINSLLPAIAMDPRANVTTTQSTRYWWFAQRYKLALDRVFAEVQANKVFREATLEAFFGLGVLKTGVAARSTSGVHDPEGYLHDDDQIYVAPVDLDDYVCDVRARRREAMSYEGNVYLVPYQWAMDTYPAKAHPQLMELRKRMEGDKGEGRTGDLATGGKAVADQEEFVLRIPLFEGWLPHHEGIVTMAGIPDVVRGYIEEREWEGPETGPYDTLGFNEVPGNLLALPKVATVYDLHCLVNEIGRKIARQAQRQKDVPVYEAGAEEDAERIKNASDGEWTKVSSLKRIDVLNLGGANEHGFEAVQGFQEWFTRVAGNTDLIGGLGAQSKTLGQDQMLMQNSMAVVGLMRQRFLDCAKSVLSKMAEYLWNDFTTEMELEYPVASGFPPLPLKWTGDDRRGEYGDYVFELEAYGVRHDDPQQEYERIVQWFERVLFPLAQVAGPQGMLLDVEKAGQITGAKLNIKELEALWKVGPPIPLGAPQQGGKPQGHLAGAGGQQAGQRALPAPQKQPATSAA